MKEILLNVEPKQIRAAHLKNGVLHDLTVQRKKDRNITGNIYKGYVIHILLNIQSAFIRITKDGENGFIHISDILENREKFEKMFDLDFTSGADDSLEQPGKIDQLLHQDQPVIVQVVKEPIGTKGARLTSKISLPGRYLVLLPNSAHRGVSRKIEDRTSRERLKKIIRSFEMPQDMGLICRTASQSASQEQLIEEANELFETWQRIIENFNTAPEASLLYEESDIIKQSMMTCINKGYQRLLIDDYATHQRAKRMYAKYADELSIRIEYYRDKIPMFERFNIEREIEKSLRRKLWLSSGGYLFFDQTEAMHTIDVNSGRSSQGSSEDVEETLLQINLEAAEEIARQLRIRNIGGLIVCDFIDMRFRKNQRRLLDHLKDCMKADLAKCTILGMSEFGLIEMTRQRSRGSLMQTMFTHCPYCSGSGHIKTHESLLIEIERAIKKAIHCLQQYSLRLVIHPEVKTYIDNHEQDYFFEYAESVNAKLEIEMNDSYHMNEYAIFSGITQKQLEV